MVLNEFFIFLGVSIGVFCVIVVLMAIFLAWLNITPAIQLENASYNRQIRISKEARDQNWQTLAERHGLKYIKYGQWTTHESFINLIQTTYISGFYKGYHLDLSLFQITKSLTGTRITVSRKLSEPLPPVRAQKQPLDLETALTLLTRKLRDKSQVHVKYEGRKVFYEYKGVEDDQDQLQDLFDFLIDLIEAYPKMICLGGTLLRQLESYVSAWHLLRGPFVRQLAHDIGRETCGRLKDKAHDLLCPTCLVRCGVNRFNYDWLLSSEFYGCRRCGQSQSFIEGQAVAVLDDQMHEAIIKDDTTFYVNWLNHRELFDFDRVEIRSATDEDVERFAVQVGNDTDLFRKERYREMDYIIAPDCQLSPNTKRILAQIFRKVDQVSCS